MADMKLFHLPDLGEGLPDAEIVEWHVKVGDKVTLDAPLVSMETAKAVVDVPSPYTGTVLKLFGKAGDVIDTSAALAGFELEAGAAQRAEAEPTGHHHAPAAHKGAGKPVPDEASRDDGGATTVIASDEGGEILDDDKPAPKGDAGTVVGAMESSDRVHAERTTSVGGVKAVPAVRALAKKLNVDLARVKASGAGGVVTIADVKSAAAAGLTKRAVGGAEAPTAQRATEAKSVGASAPPTVIPEARSQSGKPMRTVPHTVRALGQPEQIKGVRRN